MFDRDRLQKIREEAMKESDDVRDGCWYRALINFADAADRLDAMVARTEDHISVEAVVEPISPLVDAARLIKWSGEDCGYCAEEGS